MSGKVASPCVKVCLLEGQLCVGCGRTLDEIAEWPRADADRRRAILAQAARRQDDLRS